MKQVSILLFLLVLFQNSNAADKNKPLSRFNFMVLNGGSVIIRAQVDTISDTLNFILDTGCGGISLDSATAEEYHIPTVKTDINVVGIAGTRLLSFAYNHSLILNGFKIDSLQYHINDYEILTCANGIRIDGVIGYSLFKKYIISINYDDNTIELYDSAHFTYPRKGYYIYPNINPLPHLDIQLSDAKAIKSNLIFDTGAGLFCLLNNQCEKETGLVYPKRKKYRIQAEGIGGKKEADLTVINKLKIGKYSFRNVPVYLIDDENNVTGYPAGCGLIGNEILRRFNTIFDYPHKTIYLKPNNHFYDLFDYSYTGLSVFDLDGKVTVTEIMPESPGKKAGFEADDVIIAIDNVIINNIQQCKSLFQNIGKTLLVWIERDGKTKLLKLDIKNIQD